MGDRSLRHMLIKIGIAIVAMMVCGGIMYWYQLPEWGAAFSILCTGLWSGFTIGSLGDKWRQDKERSRIVAERLLRKPDVADVSGRQISGTVQATVAKMAHTRSNAINNLLGQYPENSTGSGLGSILGKSSLE